MKGRDLAESARSIGLDQMPSKRLGFPSPSGRGICSPTGGKCFRAVFEYGFRLLQRLKVQNLKTLRPARPGSRRDCGPFTGRRKRAPASIHLDRQLQFVAVEIQDVELDRVSTPELEAGQRPIPSERPEQFPASVWRFRRLGDRRRRCAGYAATNSSRSCPRGRRSKTASWSRPTRRRAPREQVQFHDV